MVFALLKFRIAIAMLRDEDKEISVTFGQPGHRTLRMLDPYPQLQFSFVVWVVS
jgi:hypothetical protein